MLFNSYAFLFGFFPVTLACYLLFSRIEFRLQLSVALAGSLFFYAWWDIRFLPLLIGSFTFNYLIGWAICAYRGRRDRASAVCLAVGITANLVTLAFFKYVQFALDNINVVFDSHFIMSNIILPLGISFFTFEQISFLVDVRRGEARPGSFIHYALFVSFFPRLVAGPILRYREIAPQFADLQPRKVSEDLAIGLTLFAIGLAKKSLLADGIAPHANPVFAAAGNGEALDLLSSWGGALAYTCQLYFDFSGYSDMAIGAARCFGITFPANFNSPYKATNIIDFWRRWHMTLSRFLRDYLYFALGGNRRGRFRRYLNLLVTMLLGGFWHGASWTFIVWGGLHGIYLMMNHGWAALSELYPRMSRFRASGGGAAFGWAITFVAVVVSWVFFRSVTFSAAFNLLAGMAGLHGITIPSGLEFAFGPVSGLLKAVGIRFTASSGSELVMTYLWVSGLLGIALLLPNTQELLSRAHPVLESDASPIRSLKRRWELSRSWAVALGCIAFLGLISITRVSQFLYWQF